MGRRAVGGRRWSKAVGGTSDQHATLRWIAGADHAGRALKDELVAVLRELGDEVDDLGTDSDESVDYPDFGAAVAKRVAAGDGLGLLVCGTGIGISIAANKVAGVRAAVVTNEFTARATREHNDANAIAFGARVVGPGVAAACLRAYRDATFEGGRHQRRVDKLGAIAADSVSADGSTG